MRVKGIFLGFLAIFILSFPAAAMSIGTAPGVYDLGELDSGKNVAFRFYLMTNAKNDMLVTLSYVPVHQDMYEKSETRSFSSY